MQSLGTADTAIAAGVNLQLLGGTTAAICQLQALSPAGRCRTFDAAADGYGRGEGVAALVLQPSGASSTTPLAVLCGSAINQARIPQPDYPWATMLALLQNLAQFFRLPVLLAVL